jgi:hypothetical protein
VSAAEGEARVGAVTGAAPEVSVVVPVNERPEPLPALYEEYAAPLRELGTFEFIFVLQPWARELAEELAPLIGSGEPIRVLEVGQSVSESSLLKIGAQQASGSLLLTLPAYRRVQADAVPLLIERVEEGVDLATACRSPRKDPWFNRLQNRVFHTLVGSVVGGSFTDLACGVRAMRPEVLRQTALYGDNFRFLPLLARREGYVVVEVGLPQHRADARFRMTSLGVYLRRLIDVLGMFFLLRFTEKPLRFFGLVGAVLSTLGALILLVLLAQRIAGTGIADRPVLLLGVLLFVLGAQAIALGLVGEIIVHLHAPHRTTYRLLRSAPDPAEHDTDSVMSAGRAQPHHTDPTDW